MCLWKIYSVNFLLSVFLFVCLLVLFHFYLFYLLISPLFFKVIFPEYVILGWQFFSFSIWKMLCHLLLTCVISEEKYTAIQIIVLCNGLNVCVPHPKFICWNPNLSCDCIQRWGLWEGIKVTWGHEGGSWSHRTDFLYGDTLESGFCVHAPRKGHVRSQQEGGCL